MVKYNSSEKLSLLATSHIHKSRVVPYIVQTAVSWMMRKIISVDMLLLKKSWSGGLGESQQKLHKEVRTHLCANTSAGIF